MTQIAVVTGAAQGLGFVIAGRLLAAGYRVAVTDRSEALATEAVARLGGGDKLLALTGPLGKGWRWHLARPTRCSTGRSPR